MIEMNSNAGSFWRGAKDLSIVKSHDDCISADQLQTKQYPLFDNIAAVERAIFDSFVVTGPMISQKDSKKRVCDVPRRSDKGAKDKLKKSRTKLRGGKPEAVD
jgi:hypothetical protein